MAKENIDNQIGMIKSALDGLTDEVIETRNGGGMLVHHIDGDTNNKLVLSTIRKGKSRLPIHDPEVSSNIPSKAFNITFLAVAVFGVVIGRYLYSTGVRLF